MKFISNKIITQLFLLFASANIFSQTNTSSFSGTIVDKITKNPISSALVVLKNDTQTYSNRSDTLGRFLIKNILPNRYELTISFIGYSRVHVPAILITSGKEEVLDIELTR